MLTPPLQSRALLIGLALVFTACPKPKPEPTDGQIEPGTEALARSLCSYYARCEGSIGRVFETAEACSAYWSKAVTCDNAISFASEDAMRACAARLDETIDCAYDTDDPASACAGVFLGPAMSRVGEACIEGMCNFDSFCRYGQEQDACPVCVKYAAEGEACVLTPGAPDYRPCDDKSYCNAGQCAPKKDLGFSCTAAEQCAHGVCRNGMCAKPLPLGASCTGNDLCEGRFRLCMNGVCSDRKVPGAACDRDQQCLPSDECVDGVCRRFAVCEKRKAGERCDLPGQCVADYYCGPSMGGLRCLPVVAPGGSCTASIEACGPQGFCNVQNTTCSTRVMLDGSCPGTGCVSGAYCNAQNTCRTLKVVGESCEQYWECDSQLCDGMPKKCIDGRVCNLPDGGTYRGRDAGM